MEQHKFSKTKTRGTMSGTTQKVNQYHHKHACTWRPGATKKDYRTPEQDYCQSAMNFYSNHMPQKRVQSRHTSRSIVLPTLDKETD